VYERAAGAAPTSPDLGYGLRAMCSTWRARQVLEPLIWRAPATWIRVVGPVPADQKVLGLVGAL
jgi:hypothetical protein